MTSDDRGALVVALIIAEAVALGGSWLWGLSVGIAAGREDVQFQAVNHRVAIYHPVTREFTWTVEGPRVPPEAAGH